MWLASSTPDSPLRRADQAVCGTSRQIPGCLTEHGGVEWTEVIRPTRTMPLDALRITPINSALHVGADWS
jgi:hypothetical protein